MRAINILAIADIHYIGLAKHICNIENRRTERAIEFIQRILCSEDIHKIDVILLLGDLVDNGNAPGAEVDMELLSKALLKTGKPVFVIPGNHDASSQRVFEIFNDQEGLHEVEGYQIITFADEYGQDDTCIRSIEKMDKLFAGFDPGRPVIVLQHNPVYPAIDSPYPYNIQNACDVMEYYTKKGVILSISGHAHWGIPTEVRDNVGYLTCPALCEEPFRYTLITLKENQYEIEVKSLA